MKDTKGICKDEDILFRTPTYIEYVKNQKRNKVGKQIKNMYGM